MKCTMSSAILKRFGLMTLGVTTALPVYAQDVGADPMTRDTITVGAGIVARPSYDGSDDYVVSPLPVIRGRVSGITINPRPGGIALDLIPDTREKKVNFALGPVAALSFNRNNQIEDPVVKAAGKLDTAVELGVNAGISVNNVLNDFDRISFTTDVQWDVAGAYSGMTFSPAISYATPINSGVLVTVIANAHHVDDKYASYYYSVTPAQAAASGLPEYNAKGGWDKVGLGTLVAVSLSGNLIDGGWSVLGVAGYSHMLNDGKNTPYTALRGNANQWVGGLGLTYTF